MEILLKNFVARSLCKKRLMRLVKNSTAALICSGLGFRMPNQVFVKTISSSFDFTIC